MKAVFLPGLLPIEEDFGKRLSAVYRAMVQRFGERRFKSGPRKGQIFREARVLPFTKQEFLGWVQAKLCGIEGAVQCHYCAQMLDARTIGFDHEYPIQQGGSLQLLNLVPSCASCNREKGGLTPAAFAWLRTVLKSEIGKNLTIADSREITMRLKSGGITFSKSTKARKEKRDAATTAPPWLLEK